MGKIFDIILTVLLKILVTVYGLVSLVIMIMTEIADRFLAITAYLVVELIDMAGPGFEVDLGQVSEYLSFANAFFPLAEFWAMLSIAIPFLIGIAIFRFVKQFIPTVSN